MFMLMEDGRAKLKAFSATTRAGKHTLKIELEYSSAYDMAFDIESLEEVQAAQKPARKAPRKQPAKAKPKQIAAETRLALPAPGGDA